MSDEKTIEGLTDVGVMAMNFMEELREGLPDGAEIGNVGICVSFTFICPNCEEVHEEVAAVTDTGSRIFGKALFAEAICDIERQHAPSIVESEEDD